MPRTHGSPLLVAALLLAISLAGCTAEEPPASRQEAGLDPETKPLPLLNVRLDDATEARYLEQVGDQELLVLPSEEATVLQYDVQLAFGSLEEPVNATLVWRIDDANPLDAAVVGEFSLRVAAVDTNATVPVTIIPSGNLSGEGSRLLVEIQSQPQVGASTSIFGFVFR